MKRRESETKSNFKQKKAFWTVNKVILVRRRHLPIYHTFIYLFIVCISVLGKSEKYAAEIFRGRWCVLQALIKSSSKLPAMDDESISSGEPDLVLIRVRVGELNVEKCLQFQKDEVLWEVKQQTLAALPKVSWTKWF